MNLIIWNSWYSYIKTVVDYVNSFNLLTEKTNFVDIYVIFQSYMTNKKKFNIFFNDLKKFKNIIIHYSCIHGLVMYTFRNEPQFNIYNIQYNFFKNLFSNLKNNITIIIQDEYYDTNKIKQMIKDFNAKLILSCIPKEHQRKVYDNVPNVRIEQVLTGYVLGNNFNKIPISERKTLIFYRGKTLPFYYGRLGQWKQYIGIKMKNYCDKNNITHINIAWDEKDKIYGDKWLTTMMDAKVTLATPSGLNIFYYDDKKIIECNKRQTNPNYTYEMAKSDFNLEDEDFEMGQIAPKMFEAIMCGTVLVMYPGTYSNILKKDIHYIELQPDFSNIKDVMEKIKDDKYLQDMSNRAYKDIVESGKYSYKTFIRKVEGWLNEL